MALARAFASQLARPHGMAGRLLGTAMDVANRRPTRLAIDLLAPKAGEEVLDAGCGTGAAMAEVACRTACALTGVDLSETMLHTARRKLGGRARCVHSRLESLPFADASFDAILALNVLYFCDAEASMLSSFRRVLKPGGRLVAYVTARQTMESWPFAQEGIHRLYDRIELTDLFLRAGFARTDLEVQEVRITGSVKGLLARALR